MSFSKETYPHVHPISEVTNLQTSLDAKQSTLVSATNIKTVNGTSLLGSGNIAISSGAGDMFKVDNLSGLANTATARTNIGLGSVPNTDFTSAVAANTAKISYTDGTKVAGIATGATANDTDANLKNRANHTGVQAQSTVTNLVSDLAGKEKAVTEVTVTTAHVTAAKIGTTVAGSYTPTYGDRINVTFTLGISVASPTLNIDSSGVKSIFLGTTAVSTTVLSTAASSAAVPLWYDGTRWQMYGSQLNTDTNTTYAEISSADITAGTATTLATITGRRAQEIVNKALTTVTKSNVGLSNVDNTSDATKNSATATLTNKIINASQLVDGSVTASKIEVQQAWISPTLINSWVNYNSGFDTAGYMKDSMGFVHLKGLVKSGSGSIFTLPSGYRVAATQDHACFANGVYAFVELISDGSVIGYGSNAYFSLNGITFKADA